MYYRIFLMAYINFYYFSQSSFYRLHPYYYAKINEGSDAFDFSITLFLFFYILVLRTDANENAFKTESRFVANKKIVYLIAHNPSTRGGLSYSAYVYSRMLDSGYFCSAGYPWESMVCRRL